MLQTIKVHNPYSSRAQYKHERLESPSHFDPRSFRVVSTNRKKVAGKFSTWEGKGLYPASHSIKAWFMGSPKHSITKSVRRHKRKYSSNPKIIIGCPKGFYSPSTGRCKVGTRAQSILTPKRNLRARRTYSTRESSFYPSPRSRKIGFWGGVWGSHAEKAIHRRLRRRPKKGSRPALFSKNAIIAPILYEVSSFGKKLLKRKPRIKLNPHLALIGGAANPSKGGSTMARRRRMPPRNAKGRFVKANRRHRKRTRRNAPRVRSKTIVKYKYRNRTKIKYRTRRANTVARRRTRKRNDPDPARRRRRRYTRRNYPRRHYRRHYRSNPRRHYRRHHRRNVSLQSLVPSMSQGKLILWGAAGGFVGSKVTGLLMDKVLPASITSMNNGLVRLGVGAVVTALAWRVNPAFGLGAGIGAFATLTDQLFNWLWGIQAGYTGLTGLQDYVHPGYKLESGGWASLPAAVAPGNPSMTLAGLEAGRFRRSL